MERLKATNEIWTGYNVCTFSTLTGLCNSFATVTSMLRYQEQNERGVGAEIITEGK